MKAFMLFACSMLTASARYTLTVGRVTSLDMPLFRARCPDALRPRCRAVAPRFAFDVRLDPRLRHRAQFVITPVELLPDGGVVELDAFSLCETQPSLTRAVQRAACLAGSADLARFDETAFLAA